MNEHKFYEFVEIVSLVFGTANVLLFLYALNFEGILGWLCAVFGFGLARVWRIQAKELEGKK